MFYLFENMTDNLFNHQQWWKDMKKKIRPRAPVQKAKLEQTTQKHTNEIVKVHQSRVSTDEAEIEIDIETN